MTFLQLPCDGVLTLYEGLEDDVKHVLSLFRMLTIAAVIKYEISQAHFLD
jgi:hypothetical protein